MATNIVFSGEELQRHVLTSTRAWWLLKPTPREKRVDAALKIADYCWVNRLPIQSLACLRVASRLGADPDTIDGRIAELDAAVERDMPIAGVLPSEFDFVPNWSPDYARLLDTAGFPRPSLPFRNTAITTATYRKSKRIHDRALHRLDFMLLRKGIPVSLVEGSVIFDLGVMENDHPVRVQFGRNAPRTGLFRITELTLDVLKLLAMRYGACDIQLDDIAQGPMQTVVGRAASVREYVPELRAAPFVNLAQKESEIWSGVRDSYRALIRAESKAMSLRYFNRESPDHQAVDGWRRMLVQNDEFDRGKFGYAIDRISGGPGEVVAGFLDNGRCCAATAIFDDGPFSLYEAGNYLETEASRKASHYPLYEAILRAKSRGQRRFYLCFFGEPTARQAFDGEKVVLTSKTRAINFFKRGFSETIERKFVFRLIL